MCTYGDANRLNTRSHKRNKHKSLLHLFVCSVLLCVCVSFFLFCFFCTVFWHSLKTPKGKNGHRATRVSLGLGPVQHSTAWNRAVSCGSGLVLAWVGLVQTEFWLFVAEESFWPLTHTTPLSFFSWLINRSPLYLMHTKQHKILYIKVSTHTYCITISSTGDVTPQSNTKKIIFKIRIFIERKKCTLRMMS